MDERVTYFLVDTEYNWDTWSEEQRKSLAATTLQEWICSDKFKDTASFSEIEAETTIGRRVLQFRAEDQYWKEAEYKQCRDLLESIYLYWVDSKWAYIEQTRNGRPRRAEYSASTMKKAAKYANPPFMVQDGEENVHYKSVTWARRVLGESSTQTWVKLVVIREALYSEIYRRAGAEYFTGCTKEEIAETLSLPKKFVNALCRWLVEDKGWRMASVRREGKRVRVLQLTAVA